MTQQWLIHFHIGPVQSFIAAGRRTQDLLVGSWLLSELAKAGVEAAQRAHADLLYPSIVNGALPASVPNLFAFLTTEQPRDVAVSVEDAIRERWASFTAAVKDWLARQVGGGGWEAAFDRQVSNWMELYWVAVKYDPQDHAGSFDRVKRAMAARKNARHLPQVEEPGRKCTLTGAASALPLNWNVLRDRVGETTLRKNEELGAIALVKRFAQDAGLVPERTYFPSTDQIAGKPESTGDGKLLEGYYAILLMDGDRMGEKLGKLTSSSDHQRFSAALAAFADQTVPEIIEAYDQHAGAERMGQAALVYAGGDDVLALLPLKYALACAEDIRTQYAEIMARAGGIRDATMSAGIAIVPVNYPLDQALEEARKAEKIAKNAHGRNAVVVSEVHGTGQQRIAGAQWQTDGVAIVNAVQGLISAFSEPAWLSASIGYDMQALAHDLVGGPVSAEIRAAELTRLIKRRSMNFHERAEDRRVPLESFAHDLSTLGEAPTCGWESLANWVILARFLATGGRRS
jgi:CRISPR-associated protein Cmr2